MNFRALQPREWIFLILLFVVPVGVYMIVFKPRGKADVLRQAAVATKQADLQTLDTLRGVAEKNNKADREKLQEGLAAIRKRHPYVQDTSTIIYDLSALAHKHKLTPDVKSDRNASGDNETVHPGGVRYVEKEFTVVVSGRFSDFYAFLQELESQPKVIQIQEMLLTRTARTTRTEQGEARSVSGVKVKIDLHLFFRKPTANSKEATNG